MEDEQILNLYFSRSEQAIGETASKYGRVVELVDSLDSGSSVHCGRAGSSPASPTKSKRTSDRVSSCLFE